MTIQERNEYLTEQSWFQQERQHLFDMSVLKKGTKYNNYGEILQAVGIDKETRKNKYTYYKEKLDYFLCTQKQKDGQIKITKIKGELVENPFSWELREPFMSTGYMLEMMIIHILDNHLNKNWDKNKWCEVLGLIPAKKEAYNQELLHYPESFYFDMVYDCVIQIAHTRLHDTFVNMEKRGVIKRNTLLMCRKTPKEPLRGFNEAEVKAYARAYRRITGRWHDDIDIRTAKIYPSVYPRFQKELKRSPEFKNLYYRFVYAPEYLFPEEHSYLTKYEFFLYQKRMQQNISQKVLKLAQSKKEAVIMQVAKKYRFAFREPGFPKDCPAEFQDEISNKYELSTLEFWSKKLSRYRTDVRKVVDFAFKVPQKLPSEETSFSLDIGA